MLAALYPGPVLESPLDLNMVVFVVWEKLELLEKTQTQGEHANSTKKRPLV